MKKYIAAYEGGWSLGIFANNYKDALKNAREQQKEYGKLWSLRMERK